MKSARDEMDIVHAYQAVGSYRGAAELCGTTHKTVKRVVQRQAAGQVGRRSAPPCPTAAQITKQSALGLILWLAAYQIH